MSPGLSGGKAKLSDGVPFTGLPGDGMPIPPKNSGEEIPFLFPGFPGGGKSLVSNESLILAQNQRWRRA